MLLEQLEQLHDVAHTGQVDRMMASQLLDGLQFHDVALREAPPVGRRPLGDDEAEVLIHHERPRMRFEDLGRHADGVDRLVEGDTRVASGITLDKGWHRSLHDVYASRSWIRRRARDISERRKTPPG